MPCRVLIVPFMELKPFSGAAVEKLYNVLIVPFMELKLINGAVWIIVYMS